MDSVAGADTRGTEKNTSCTAWTRLNACLNACCLFTPLAQSMLMGNECDITRFSIVGSLQVTQLSAVEVRHTARHSDSQDVIHFQDVKGPLAGCIGRNGAVEVCHRDNSAARTLRTLPPPHSR